MTATTAVFKRELRGYFGTPVAYVFLVVFLFLAAFLTFSQGFFRMRDASLRIFFANLPALFALFAPAIAMRMWAEERRTGTVELLLTLPVTVKQAVLGKFFAGWAFFGIALVLSMSLVLTVAYLGDPDPGPLFTGYLGAFLMAGAYLAVGAFFSAMTKNQVISFVLGAAACAALVYAGSPSVVNFVQSLPLIGDPLARFVESMSFLTHYDVLQRGLIDLSDLIFMVGITAGFVVATILMLDESKAR